MNDAHTYLLQRRLFSWVTSGNGVDPLAVDEMVIELLDRVLRSTCTSRLFNRFWLAVSQRGRGPNPMCPGSRLVL